MPIFPLFLLAAQSVTAGDVCDRLTHYVMSHPDLAVKVEVVKSTDGAGLGWIKIHRPTDAAVSVKVGAQEYSARLQYPRSMESVPSQQTYNYFDQGQELGFDFSTLYDSVRWLGLDILISINHLNKAEWAYKGRQGDVDTIAMNRAYNATAIAHYEFDIDTTGRLLRQTITLVQRADGPGVGGDGPRGPGRVGVARQRPGEAPAKPATPAPKGPDLSGKSELRNETRFSDYNTSPIDLATIMMEPQVGWNALALPTIADPAALGQPLPTGKIVGPDGSHTTLGAELGTTGVVEVLDPEWASSEFGMAVLKKVEGKFKSAGLSIVRLNDEATGKTSGYSHDPSGDVLRMLSAPGSPCFFWYDHGRLKQAWFACSPREPEQLFKDIDAALADGKSQKTP